MKKIKQFSAPIILLLFLASFLLTGCSEKKTENPDLQQLPSAQHLPPAQRIPSFVADTTKKDNSMAGTEGRIVRQGIIDLKAIDRNGDGKVYECPMDYNVISDNPGSCPQCKMDLEKVSLDKAKENLKASNFRVK